ncbi:MAG: HPr(Ser) kinase/phosphatase [Oscillospiraceae bacterium]|jgi:HPr kinase/phosphorylase|nr:HPr(Ser) kinase/phosphatase [Oscillospiraceae bacterium]
MKPTITLAEIIKKFDLTVVHMPYDAEEIVVIDNDINRPGLQLAGFYDYFNPNRIQIMGKMEHAYLDSLSKENRRIHIAQLFERKIKALVVARELLVFPEMLELAEINEIPILSTLENTSTFSGALIAFLNLKLSQIIQRHGTLMEIAGEGVLITGESGVGKSEVAIELVRRGHRLIADDAVEIRKVSNITLVGSAPENLRHVMELRGVGLINIAHTFGSSAVKNDIKIDLIVHLEEWNEDNTQKVFERLGNGREFTNVLDVKVPSMTIPVRTGRNIAIILEVAAITSRERRLGYSAVDEFFSRMGMEADEAVEVVKYLDKEKEPK